MSYRRPSRHNEQGEELLDFSRDRSTQNNNEDLDGFDDNALDEINASAPIDRNAESTDHFEDRQKTSKDQRDEGSDGFDDNALDEVNAPQPIDRDAEDANHLEDRSGTSRGERASTKDSVRAPWQRQFITVSYLIFFSIFGTLARLGVQWLTFFPGAPVSTTVLWANIGGSWFMGFLSEDLRLFSHPLHDPELSKKHDMSEEDMKKHHGTMKKTIPLYVGLATGFCGSFTSFSSFMRDAFLAISNDLPSPYSHTFTGPPPSLSSTYPRNGGYSILSVLAIVIIELGLSLCALIVGAHTAISLDRILPSIPYNFSRRVLDPAIMILGPGCWFGAVLLAVFAENNSWRGEVLFAIVFAPVGCLTRFYASLQLNPLVKSFPMGTFAVNMTGSAVEAMCFDLQRVRIGGGAGGSVLGCQILQGMQDGFCGCLTTVSTWVGEIKGLRRRHGYVYASASVVLGISLMIVLMGSVRWSIGWLETSCTTARTTQ